MKWAVLRDGALSLDKEAGAGSTQVRQAGPHTGDFGAAGSERGDGGLLREPSSSAEEQVAWDKGAAREARRFLLPQASPRRDSLQMLLALAHSCPHGG